MNEFEAILTVSLLFVSRLAVPLALTFLICRSMNCIQDRRRAATPV